METSVCLAFHLGCFRNNLSGSSSVLSGLDLSHSALKKICKDCYHIQAGQT